MRSILLLLLFEFGLTCNQTIKQLLYLITTVIKLILLLFTLVVSSIFLFLWWTFLEIWYFRSFHRTLWWFFVTLFFIFLLFTRIINQHLFMLSFRLLSGQHLQKLFWIWKIFFSLCLYCTRLLVINSNISFSHAVEQTCKWIWEIVTLWPYLLKIIL